MEALCPAAPEKPASQGDHWGALIAGQSLAESACLEQIEAWEDEILKRVQHWQVHILECGELPAVEHALAGRNLAKLDDPASAATVGICRASPPGLSAGSRRAVPHGQPPAKGPAAYEDEQPQHELSLPLFYIARYPTTNAQFAAFVLAGGYGESRLWGEAQAANSWTQAGFQSHWDAAPRQKPYDFGAPFNLPNHPAVGFAWFEALAYTRWLGEQLAEWARQGGVATGNQKPGRRTFLARAGERGAYDDLTQRG